MCDSSSMETFDEKYIAYLCYIEERSYYGQMKDHRDSSGGHLEIELSSLH
ncbi:hypothetical protein Scep_007839 [Stephania cephalantha]|uniref:Uncharacterized protein n=1 Tax=Stephania cephalantha TaxID=152367 RepID=A0AAP0KAV4_9MAGN